MRGQGPNVSGQILLLLFGSPKTKGQSRGGYQVSELRKFGPKPDDASSIGNPCPACRKSFKAGDYTTIVSLGPGDDPEEQAKARTGRAYNAVASEVHFACATGETNP